jgi:hypothetical protein
MSDKTLMERVQVRLHETLPPGIPLRIAPKLFQRPAHSTNIAAQGFDGSGEILEVVPGNRCATGRLRNTRAVRGTVTAIPKAQSIANLEIDTSGIRIAPRGRWGILGHC